MAPDPKFTLAAIIAKVREVWIETGAMPAVHAVRRRVGGGDADRIELGISLVGAEHGINCAALDAQPAEIRALVTDPRGPTGIIPLDPLTRALIPEGVLAGAIALLKSVAAARALDERELERRVGLERARADAIANACETRITAALAAQLSAEQRYANQDATHERSTRELRAELAAAQETIRLRTEDASALSSLTQAVTETCTEVRDVAGRLDKVERTLATRRRTENVPATPAASEPHSDAGKEPFVSRPARVRDRERVREGRAASERERGEAARRRRIGTGQQVDG